MKIRIARMLAPVIGALALALPGAAAAQVPALPGTAPEAETAAPATESTAAPTSEPAPSAAPAQSGPNEYSEGGVPTGTGEDEDPAPVQEPPASDDDTAPTGSGGSAPTGSSAPAAPTTAAPVTTSETGLPRTGADTWLLALVGVALFGTGVLIRRAVIATRA